MFDAPGVRWLDVVDPTPDELAALSSEFGLHPMAVEDITEPGQRPKLAVFENHAFIVAYAASLSEIDIFIGDSWVLTVRERSDDGRAWDATAARTYCDRYAAHKVTVGTVLHAVLDDIVDGYFIALDASEDRIEALEDEVFDPKAHEPAIQQKLFDIRRELVAFRRKVVPLRDVLAGLLRGEVATLDTESLLLMQDVYDHLLRSVDTIDSHRELMGNAVDAHLAIISNGMNDVMKKMTSWGALLFGATLISGIYGMNFQHMPELGWEYGYPFALGTMVVMVTLGYLYFRRRDWL